MDDSTKKFIQEVDVLDLSYLFNLCDAEYATIYLYLKSGTRIDYPCKRIYSVDERSINANIDFEKIKHTFLKLENMSNRLYSFPVGMFKSRELKRYAIVIKQRDGDTKVLTNILTKKIEFIEHMFLVSEGAGNHSYLTYKNAIVKNSEREIIRMFPIKRLSWGVVSPDRDKEPHEEVITISEVLSNRYEIYSDGHYGIVFQQIGDDRYHQIEKKIEFHSIEKEHAKRKEDWYKYLPSY